MVSSKNPLRNLTPTEADLDNNSSNSNNRSSGGEKLREKAAKTLHGPNANPSQLGDPVSLKAETSDSNIDLPTQNSSSSSSSLSSSSKQDKKGGKETLREKAAKKLHGPDANPSQLGDPISLKAETTEHHGPAPGEEGTQGSHSSEQQRKKETKSRL
ncbi:hypothetical protein BD289DRAFT_485909 [Coniella lustricola]|uniref:Uncharacterized protein n=1 Tax=Coniella lustricola TaxID=2025994 RepID=A0A2T2ZX07_9PEZI|nr:hypothetical protein BD289DRAFT_485909 [Coniella lustricola]